MAGLTLIGCVIAGLYGIVHDQVTYSIGPEYFTHFKFDQFAWANSRLGDRVFVSCIGFLATWWVGLIATWILVRRLVVDQPRRVACRNVFEGFLTIFLTAVVFGVGGFLYGNMIDLNHFTSWTAMCESLGVVDTKSFIVVACIHSAGYLGGIVGLGLTFFIVKRKGDSAG